MSSQGAPGVARGSLARRCAALVAVVGLALATAACGVDVTPGRYSCDLARPSSCPAGHRCLITEDAPEPRCYETGLDVCGNGVVGAGEECDGFVPPAGSCYHQGFWGGQPACSAACEIQTASCTGLARIFPGTEHTCAIDTAGAAFCWGRNLQGELGTGDLAGGALPRPVTGGLKFTELTMKGFTTCGLADSGKAYCWGGGAGGALGDGTNVNHWSPSEVVGGIAFSTVEMGMYFACALEPGGTLWCWGQNSEGQLGDDSPAFLQRTVPAPVAGDHEFTAFTAGKFHACALDAQQQAWCWGMGRYGRLGDGTTESRSVPTVVSGGLRFSRISGGTGHTCGLDEAGKAYCFGNNRNGQLGSSDGIDERHAPTAVSGDLRFSEIHTGARHTCALDEVGQVYCWGSGAEGQRGPGNESGSTPTLAQPGQTFQSLAVGAAYTCGVTAAGDGWCWGWNGSQQLSRPTEGFRPVRVAAAQTWQRLGIGWETLCGLTPDGSALCWGDGLYGQIGAGFLRSETQPTLVAGAHHFVQVGGSASSACGLDDDGSIWCWGDGGFGQLGNGASLLDNYVATTPELVLGAHSFASLAAGANSACGIDVTGAAWCWGFNYSGNLGDGTRDDSSTPVPVTGDHRFQGLSAAQDFTCGIDDAGVAWCWGYNSTDYSLGNGTTINSNEPVEVTGGHTFGSIHSGVFHTCALDLEGRAWCWGANAIGQLGIGCSTLVAIPVAVVGDLRFSTIRGGFDHTCALDLEGQAWCWGGNAAGQLGVSEPVPSSVPRLVTGEHHFVALEVGFYLSCGVTASGELWCWGANQNAMKGLGDRHDVPVPVSSPGG